MSYATLPETAGRVAALEAELKRVQESGHGKVLPRDFDRELRDLERLVRSQRASLASMDLVKRVGRLRSCCDVLFSSVPSSSATLLSPIREQEEASEGRGDASPRELACPLRPGQPAGEAVDEVQLLSADGLREWTDDDDAGCLERERLVIFDIQQAAANIQAMHEFIERAVSEPQDALNQIEQDVANASEQVQEGVVALQRASDMSNKRRSWLTPSFCVAGVGVGAAVAGPTAGVACAATLGKSAFVLAVGVGASYLGRQKLCEWQGHATETAGQQLQQTSQPLPPERVAVLTAAGREAERRLRMKLAQGPTWTPHRFSVTGLMSGLVPRSRRSDVSGDGYAYSTSFEVDLPALEAFQVLQRLTVSGSSVPDCKVLWSRPVDDNGTFLCHLVGSARGLDHDFFCVARCSRALTDLPLTPGDQMDDGAERYVFALTSLDQHLFHLLELPEPSSDICHGKIHVCGVVVTSTGTRGSLVEVMADMDMPAPWKLLQSASLDRDMRLHLLHSADKLRKEMSQAV
eukprot:TRINITY_DN19791_c0_g1_i1.p1 TRINITY_DN19791_c0_g1~~TRINITY_DN19791_c0_g1_i1.p1  ORF type:complete len:520 (-),score=105.40 TRINITY_DN19791_c0_g1_i1:83-1642(-)